MSLAFKRFANVCVRVWVTSQQSSVCHSKCLSFGWYFEVFLFGANFGETLELVSRMRNNEIAATMSLMSELPPAATYNTLFTYKVQL